MPVAAPPPQKHLDYTLMQALATRRSIRKWQKAPLSKQELSDLLWAACGITKEATTSSKSRRTSP